MAETAGRKERSGQLRRATVSAYESRYASGSSR